MSAHIGPGPIFGRFLVRYDIKISKFQNFVVEIFPDVVFVSGFEFTIENAWWFVVSCQNFMIFWKFHFFVLWSFRVRWFQGFKILDNEFSVLFFVSEGECFAHFLPHRGGCRKWKIFFNCRVCSEPKFLKSVNSFGPTVFFRKFFRLWLSIGRTKSQNEFATKELTWNKGWFHGTEKNSKI